ncbi:Uncharacterized protein Fot_19119 [Forsythia ovata]|uniref:Uncharacterized protein n=1 Tax=Forsythia ovata TaxID=205694 RepID=A0ABD1VLP3_9LAMI
MSQTEGPLGGKQSDFGCLEVFNADLEQADAQEHNPEPRRSKGKMVPKRGNRGSSSHGEVLESSFRFMTTPGVSHPSSVERIISGPSASMPTNVTTEVITQEVNISSTVEEVASQRAERARKRRMRNITEAPTNTSET